MPKGCSWLWAEGVQVDFADEAALGEIRTTHLKEPGEPSASL